MLTSHGLRILRAQTVHDPNNNLDEFQPHAAVLVLGTERLEHTSLDTGNSQQMPSDTPTAAIASANGLLFDTCTSLQPHPVQALPCRRAQRSFPKADRKKERPDTSSLLGWQLCHRPPASSSLRSGSQRDRDQTPKEAVSRGASLYIRVDGGLLVEWGNDAGVGGVARYE